MSILPEFVLKRVIQEGFKAVRRDMTFIDQIFWTLPSEEVQKFKDLILKQEFNITMQFPKADTVLPCIAIVLGREDETHPVIGDEMAGDIPPPDYMSKDGTNESTELGIDSDIIGEPPRLYHEDDLLEQIGAGYTALYSIVVRSTNYYVTAFTYYLMKAILTRNRPLLDSNGLLNMVIGGSDISSDVDLIPDHVFTRSLDLRFVHFFDFYIKAPVISSIEVTNIELENPDSDDPTLTTELCVTSEDETTGELS